MKVQQSGEAVLDQAYEAWNEGDDDTLAALLAQLDARDAESHRFLWDFLGGSRCCFAPKVGSKGRCSSFHGQQRVTEVFESEYCGECSHPLEPKDYIEPTGGGERLLGVGWGEELR